MVNNGTPRKTWSIKGGVHPPFNKEMSNQQACSEPSLPTQLIIPMKQMAGRLADVEILATVGDYVYKGQPLSHCHVGTLHAPTSGTLKALEKHTVPHPSGLDDNCFILEPDGKDQWSEETYPPYTDYQSLSIEDFLERIRQAGIGGLGGAVFPTKIKMETAAHHDIHTLIVNAAECEPYITCDDMLMQDKSEQIIEGIRIILTVTGIKRCLIGIENNKPQAIAALQKALTVNDKTIEIVSIPTIYPSGDERQLTYILTGTKIKPGSHAFKHGMLIQNVATINSIYEAVILGRPLISRYVTVTGRGIAQPQNFHALIGTPFSHLIHEAGGYTKQAERLIMGGPMMGYQMQTDVVPVVKGTNCILALPKEDLSYSTELAMPCIRCGKCVDACPVDLLPQQLYWHSRSEAFEQAEKHDLFSCIECGCCSYVCPSNIPLVQYYRHAKAEIRTEREAKQKSDIARKRHEFREYRKQRDKEEKARKLAEHKKKVQNKLAGDTDKKAAIKAAMERAKAKKAQQQNNTGSDTNNKPTLDDEQKAKMKAAMERAKAKKANKKPMTEEEKQAKIKAAMEAKAEKAQQTTPSSSSQSTVTTETDKPALSDEQKAKMKAAMERAKTRKAKKPMTEEEKQAKIKAAMEAKAKKSKSSNNDD
jgi:electron transport complex protein RnfC